MNGARVDEARVDELNAISGMPSVGCIKWCMVYSVARIKFQDLRREFRVSR